MRMKLHTISALFSAAAVLALTLPSQAVTIDDLKSAGFVRGATANEVPYGYMDESGAAKGIGPDVAAAIFKKLGIEEIDWTVTPYGSRPEGQAVRIRRSRTECSAGSLQAGAVHRSKFELR